MASGRAGSWLVSGVLNIPVPPLMTLIYRSSPISSGKWKRLRATPSGTDLSGKTIRGPFSWPLPKKDGERVLPDAVHQAAAGWRSLTMPR